MNHTPQSSDVLSDQMVLDTACTTLTTYVPLPADGYVCTAAMLWAILLGVSAGHTTVAGWCADHPTAPSGAAVRGHLNEHLSVEGLPRLACEVNEALAALIPARVFQAAREIAIDTHDQPYYGKTAQAQGHWIRGAAKDGTTHFYRVATAYVLWQAQRVTLAIHFVRPGDDPIHILTCLLKRLRALHFRVRRLYLDRGFDGVPVSRFLTKLRLPAVIACTLRGKQGGTRALCVGRGSYLTPYTFNATKPGAFTAHLAVCRCRTTAQRTGRGRRRPAWVLFILIGCALAPRQARRAYRRRFGIEASYRCGRQTRGKTTSPNPALRFVLLALSFVILNVWVALRWRYAQRPARGRRQVVYAHLRLLRVMRWITHALERRYPLVTEIQALATPIS